MPKYCITHPGKIGDALFSLPTIRYLAEKSGNPVDFYTSEYCEPLRSLYEYQSCVGEFVISKDYIIEGYDMGIRPYTVPVPYGLYDTVYHLGFRSIPNKRLDWWMAESVGINPLELPKISYEIPSTITFETSAPYIVLAPRGETGYKSLFLDFIKLANERLITIVQIGGKEEFIGERTGLNINFTEVDLLTTCEFFPRAKAFVGIMSAMLVLANGWSFPKIVPHNNSSWDMRHVVKSQSNYYLVEPTAEEMLSKIEGHHESN